MSTPKILVVDDSQTVRVQVRRILTNAGYQVVEATDGVDAINKVITEQPCLMILDVTMPALDGYGVCEKLRNMDESIVNPPIVFLTSLKSKALELLGNEFGAYLQKPIKVDALLAAVGKQLSQSV